jgi:hypothetical protein
MARPCCFGIWYSVSHCRERRRVAQARAEKEVQMSERSEFLHFPHWPSNAACPERSEGTTNPARLFFGDFLLAKQKKVTALPGAHPGNATTSNQTTKKKSHLNGGLSDSSAERNDQSA